VMGGVILIGVPADQQLVSYRQRSVGARAARPQASSAATA
jgi:hypothetical protein